MDKKQKTGQETQKTKNTECERAVSLRHELGADDKPLNILITLQRLSYNAYNAKLKLKAYQKLVASDFTLEENAKEWKTIDEKPEYFSDIRGKKLIETRFLCQNYPTPLELYNQSYPEES